ncbi:transcriptional regulator, XRE family with cupin sensor [Arboricoccus pini]|uniref:Transcriptional regulator, XRE family with cupin sensor n=1 Tax=Arboricoccus pini TaxID=1963835 RepID=A0A212S328_9PROT|nr:cupin domain-containing protein [Arboricoccus pini]SNB79398.1 transcriptional regulator, XRE family with cupin sensor [Arboricoccus pini]
MNDDGSPDWEGDGQALDPASDPVALLGPQIRDLRQQRLMTLSKLSSLCEMSLGHLSQVERGISTPSIRQLQAIASALGVTIGWFFRHEASLPPAEDEPFIVRAGRRRVLKMEGLGLKDELLVPDLDRTLELLLCTIQPGAGSKESYDHEGEEAGLILEGLLELWIEDRLHILEAGDSFAFESTRPHRYRNPGTVPTRVVWAITPPSF